MSSTCNLDLEFEKHIWATNEDVTLTYNNSTINLQFTSNSKPEKLQVTIVSDTYNKAFDISIEILNYLFLAIGHMPKILSFTIDNNDISENLSHYFTYSKKFNHTDAALFNINPTTLNSKTLSNINSLNDKLPVLSAFISLHSKSYELINEEHRLTLLLHSIEGYFQIKKVNDKLKVMLDKILQPFFDYCNLFKIDINNLYPYDLAELFKNIRHMYSHFVSKNTFDFGGIDYLFAFYILSYAFRLKIFSDLNIHIEESFIKEYLSSLYDWINEAKGNNVPYMSIAYKLRNIL